MTYSGHRGKGYSVQVAETSDEKNPVEVITHVEVRPPCENDGRATLPGLASLSERGLHPEVLMADTAYGSAANAVAAERAGSDLVRPVPGPSPAEASEEEERLSPAYSHVDPLGERPTPCPAGVEETEYEGREP